jgi:glyoxylate reductase
MPPLAEVKHYDGQAQALGDRHPQAPDIVETRMRELFNTRLNADDHPFSHAELIAAAKDAEVLVPTVTDRIDKAVITQAGDQLKLIANFGNGVDNIDVETAVTRGMSVTNTPGVLTEDTADMTMALILAVARRITEGARSSARTTAGRAGRHLDAGIAHLGKAARDHRNGTHRQAVARRAKAFGLQIHYHNRKPRSCQDRGGARMPPIGKASTRCWRVWTSSRSTARIRRRPIICSQRRGSSC